MPISYTHTKNISEKEIHNARALELHGLWSTHRRQGMPPRLGGVLPEINALSRDDVMVLVRQRDGSFVYQHFGRNVADALGTDCAGQATNVFEPELERFLNTWYERAIRDQNAIYTVHRAPGPRAQTWERLLLPCLGDSGAVDTLVVYIRPVLLRMELLAGIIETSHCGVMALEAVRKSSGRIIDFRIILANPLASEILGADKDGLTDQRLLKHFPEARESGLFHSFVAIADGSPPLDVQFQLAGRWLRITAARTGMGVTLTLSDVTLFKQQNEELEREIARRTEVEYELIRLATQDALTGLSNRRHFLDRAEREIQRAARSKSTASLLYLDVDHFKSVNDTYGHATGDDVLKIVAATVSEALRPYDFVGRLGGEEFAVLLPGTDLAGAMVVAERVRLAVAAAVTPIDPTPEKPTGKLQVTVSIGAGSAKSGESLEALIARADEALYAAKRGGRNQVREAA